MDELVIPPRRRYWIWILVMGTLLLMAAGGWYLLVYGNALTVHIALEGEKTVTLELGDDYREAGAKAEVCGTLFWQEGAVPDELTITTDGVVEAEKPGRYILTYTASCFGKSAQVQRTVSVIDTQSPVITLTEAEPLQPGARFEEPGYSAFDNCDGDITSRVKITEEFGVITYAVVDSSGNPAAVQRTVEGHDPVPPEILLEGGTDYVHTLGRVYREPGYSAKDNVDGDLTDQVTVEGEVDWIHPGIYRVSYSVADAYGNVTTLVRNVHVEAKPRPETIWPAEKTIYLTFDDGPGAYTPMLLDILDEYGIKATFFVVDTGCYDLMRMIVERGHSIGIHSVSHDYDEIYASPEAFFDDLYRMQQIIYDATGVRTTLMRFPGGSSNTVSRNICEGIMSTLTEAVQDAGFQYFDWNVSSGDAGDTQKTKEVVEFAINGIASTEIAMVLQHDIHLYSVEAVETIIRWGLEQGYQFLPVTENTYGFHQELGN